MATYWVADNGDDGNDGTSYAQAKATLSAGVALLSQGDTLNLVGTFTQGAGVGVTIDGTTLRGTSYNDPACIIQGVDSDGNPAHAVLETTASYYRWFTATNRPNYLIIRGIEFDPTATTAYNNPDVIRCSGTGQFPVRVEYCIINQPSAPTNGRYPVLLEAIASYSGGQEVDPAIAECRYCYLLHGAVLGDNGHIVSANHCVFRGVPSQAYGEWDLAVKQDTNTGMRGPAARVVNCTYDYRHVGASPPRTSSLFQDYNNTDDPNDERAAHSNLICVATSAAIEVEQNLRGGAFNEGASASSGTFTGTVGYNFFVFNASFAECLTGSTAAIYDAYYTPEWPASTDGTTTLYATDDITRAGTITDYINSTSAWTWTDINDSGYDIDLPKDYRLTNTTLTTAAADGGPIGAIGELINTAPTAGNVTYSGTAGVTFSVTAGEGVLSNASDPDPDTLSASLVTSPSHGSLDTFNTTTGAFEYTPNLTYTGTDTFTFKVSDGTTFSASASAIITISNATPSGQNQVYAVNENNQLSVPAASGLLTGASDADTGQTLSITGVGSPSSGTLDSYNTTTGSFVYSPDFGFVGTDSFSFQVTDGNTNSSTYTASIQVSAAVIESATNIIDTAPFFKPTLEVATEFRIKTKKNRRKHHDLANYTEKVLWDESTHRVITLATNTSTLVTLGGVADAEYLVVETDNDINVSINGNSNYWPVSSVVAVALTAATSIYLQNESTTNSAQVILAVSD